MQFKREKRAVNGVLLLDKPAGYSSNQALQSAKRLFQATKAGHTGNLDPFATGLLPLCFGEATKFSQVLLDADKIYDATLKLGATTSTGDTEGEITRTAALRFTPRDLERVLRQFTGPIAQIPPMHSALKHQGKPLYDYARRGVEVARQARQVTIYSLEQLDWQQAVLKLRVTCSKGTYIRVLAEDIGQALGCGAHLTALRRLATGGFSLDQACTLQALENSAADARDLLLRPADCLLGDLPSVELENNSTHYFRQGQAVWQAGVSHGGQLRVYACGGLFLGVGVVLADGRVAPRRLVVT